MSLRWIGAACAMLLSACETLPPTGAAIDMSGKFDTVPRVAIATAYAPEIEALMPFLQSGVEYQENGVSFWTGDMAGEEVILFATGISLVNAAMNTQLLIDHFNVEAIVVSGVAGGVDPDLSYADVTVASKWGQYNEMVFMRETDPGVYVPHPGLGPEFEPFMFMGPRGMPVSNAADPNSSDRRFWYPVDEGLMEIAEVAAETAEMKACASEDVCLPRTPKIVFGGAGVTGSVFMDNAAFREYLFETFDAQVLEMETSAIGTVAYANDVPYIAFRSLSDLAGGGGGENEYPIFEVLASENNAALVLAFLEAYD